MKIAITGASGFLGTTIKGALSAEGHAVAALARGAWRIEEGTDAVIHLAGEPVAQRWNDAVKRRIRQSRVEGTRTIVAAMSGLRERPRVLIAASAIGYYGDRGEETLTETSAPGGGFLPEVCKAWEHEADAAAYYGVRVVKLRIGIVVGRGGGALKAMLPPFRLGLGGPLGSGQQWMSWIHVDDIVGLTQRALNDESMEGAWNATAPEPVRNMEFTHALGSALKRPTALPVPAFAIRLLYGEMASVLLASQRVLPERALEHGYQFRFSGVREALSTAIAS